MTNWQVLILFRALMRIMVWQRGDYASRCIEYKYMEQEINDLKDKGD